MYEIEGHLHKTMIKWGLLDLSHMYQYRAYNVPKIITFHFGALTKEWNMLHLFTNPVTTYTKWDNHNATVMKSTMPLCDLHRTIVLQRSNMGMHDHRHSRNTCHACAQCTTCNTWWAKHVQQHHNKVWVKIHYGSAGCSFVLILSASAATSS